MAKIISFFLLLLAFTALIGCNGNANTNAANNGNVAIGDGNEQAHSTNNGINNHYNHSGEQVIAKGSNTTNIGSGNNIGSINTGDREETHIHHPDKK